MCQFRRCRAIHFQPEAAEHVKCNKRTTYETVNGLYHGCAQQSGACDDDLFRSAECQVDLVGLGLD